VALEVTKAPCWSCGDVDSPVTRDRRGAPLICDDCRHEAALMRDVRAGKIRTRASYRAAFRHRMGLRQRDWVDELLGTP
jgi:hypothetical protein